MAEVSRKGSTSRRSRSQIPSGTSSPLSVSPSSSVESLLAAQSRPRPLKVVIIGPASVGKTTLRQRYFTKRFQRNYKATIGADFEAKVVECKGSQWTTSARSKGRGHADGKGKSREVQAEIPNTDDSEPSRKVLLTVWDTAGQERFRALGSAFYRGADAVIICFDASSESAPQVQQGIHEWYSDFRDKSGLCASQNSTFCWVAVGCKCDRRGDVAVKRHQVRQMLNSLVARDGGTITEGGLQTTGRGKGDGPPADPRDVLSREGIHEEDDRDLVVTETASKSSNANDSVTPRSKGEDANDDRYHPLDKIEIGPRPGEMVARAGPTGRDPSADCQDKDHRHLQTNSGMRRSASGATDESDHTIREGERSSQDAGPQPFPSSSPAASGGGLKVPPQTPPSKISSSSLRSSHPNSSTTAPVNVRSRYDSNMSIASSAHLSIYHTPRNSQMFGSSSSSVATETGSPKATRKLALKSSMSTIGKDDHPSTSRETNGQRETRNSTESQVASLNESPDVTPQKQNGDESGAPAVPDHVNAQVNTPAAHKARSLSTASAQTLAGSKAKAIIEKNDEQPDGDLQPPVRKHLDDLPTPPLPVQGFSLFYTSSLDGTNVQAVFEHIISRCSARWDWEEYTHRMEELKAKRRSGDAGGIRRRKSIWETLRLRRKGWGKGTGLNNDEEDRMGEEVRRMVRVSDGKGDDQKGGCC